MIVEQASISEVIEGATQLETAVAEAEIIDTANNKKYKNFHFQLDAASTVSINGGDYIYIRSGQDILIDKVHSFKIKDNGIKYTWYGTKA